MKQSISLFLISLFSLVASAQYAPQYPLQGNTAISKNDERIVGWATKCTVQRGWMDIVDTALGKVTHGDTLAPLGAPTMQVLSLGDGGIATLQFDVPVKNITGPDFAIFENSFAQPTNDTFAFIELAFVEVSSDGQNFVRFPAYSAVQDSVQMTNADYCDARHYHNLAGKYIAGYGTPFDLEELVDSPNLDVQNITHIRLVDVVGTLDSAYASFDAEGKIINEAYSTPFASGGFDLAAAAILGEKTNAIPMIELAAVRLYPQPVKEKIQIKIEAYLNQQPFYITDILGRKLTQGQLESEIGVDVKEWQSGIYFFVYLNAKNIQESIRFIKL